MQVIYKYLLKKGPGRQTINMPITFGPVLKIGLQGESLYMWALVDTDSIGHDMDIVTIGTGWPIEDPLGFGSHLGTYFDSPLVWHVFWEV